MDHVNVTLNRPWPTAKGLRRPEEGAIPVTEAEATRIVDEKAGEILEEPKSPSKAKKAD